MKLEVNSININRNMTEMQLIGDPLTFNIPGKLEITGKATLIEGTWQEVDSATIKNTKMDLFTNIGGKEDYLLKNCQITSFDISTSPNGSYTSTIDIIAEDYSPAIIDIEFKDGIRKIPYRHYFNQVDYLDYDEHNKSKFKGMTYEEFMDRVMVDEL